MEEGLDIQESLDDIAREHPPKESRLRIPIENMMQRMKYDMYSKIMSKVK